MFATIPDPNGALGWFMAISRAGNWTDNVIKDAPNKIWI